VASSAARTRTRHDAAFSARAASGGDAPCATAGSCSGIGGVTLRVAVRVRARGARWQRWQARIGALRARDIAPCRDASTSSLGGAGAHRTRGGVAYVASLAHQQATRRRRRVSMRHLNGGWRSCASAVRVARWRRMAASASRRGVRWHQLARIA